MKTPTKGQLLMFACLLAAIAVISRKKDRFDDTIRVMELDKVVYDIGDTINLTLTILPESNHKTIRLYENYKNLSISFALVNRSTDVFNEEWSQRSGNTLPKTKIVSHAITKAKPFKKTFKGYIEDHGSNIVINFPRLNLAAEFEKERLRTDSISVHGFALPIKPYWADSMEDYFDGKVIKVNIP